MPRAPSSPPPGGGARPLRVALLFGGRSCEHEVSVTSARAVLDAMGDAPWEVVLIGIDKEGRWHEVSAPEALLEAPGAGGAESPSHACGATPGGKGGVGEDGLPVLLDYTAGRLLAAPGPRAGERGDPGLLSRAVDSRPIDLVFPLLHGPFGEDGTVQGLLELADIPYVGSGVLGSAVGMDKVMMKRVLRAEGLPVLPWVPVTRHAWEGGERAALLRDIRERLGLPVFAKPANLGSSIGISRVERAEELEGAIELALRFDTRALVERAAGGYREIELGVLGNHELECSVPGEIVPGREFYDYEAKYADSGTELRVPAPLEEGVRRRLGELALAAFRAVDAAGLARVDFFVARDGAPSAGEPVYINEINTLPGFTPVSMFPRVWAASGMPYPRLVQRLVELALARHRERAGLVRSLRAPGTGGSAARP